MIIENATKSYRSNANTTTNNNQEQSQQIPIQMEENVKIIDSIFHTLFVSEEDAVLKEFEIKDGDEEFTAIREIVPKHNKYTLYLSEFMHQQNQMHKITHFLRQGAEYDTLEIRVGSDGGSVSEGISLYNTMRELYTGRTTTYLDCSGYSMGAMIFSLGDIRVAYEHSEIMYHTYSGGVSGKGNDLTSAIEFMNKQYNSFFKNKIVANNFMSMEEFDQMTIGKEFWFDSYDMAKRGICTDVIVGGYRLDAEAFIQYHDQDKNIDEWVMAKLIEMSKEPETVETPTPKKKKSKPKE